MQCLTCSISSIIILRASSARMLSLEQQETIVLKLKRQRDSLALQFAQVLDLLSVWTMLLNLSLN